MTSISNFIPQLHSPPSFFLGMIDSPIMLGIITGLAHGCLQGAASLNLQGSNTLVQEMNESSKAMHKTAPSAFTIASIIIKEVTEGVLGAVYWELIFRDWAYNYFESNYPNVPAINFLVMPILFGALHFNPKIQPSLLRPISYASLGYLLASLRQTTGGITSSLTAQITNNVAVAFILVIPEVMAKARQQMEAEN